MKVQNQIKQLRRAYTRLLEAVKYGPDVPLAIDGTIQRFEFCFELAWKTLKSVLESDGTLCTSPKSCLKEAFHEGLITNEEGWLVLLEARNMTSHMYDEAMAVKIYNLITEQHGVLSDLVITLENR